MESNSNTTVSAQVIASDHSLRPRFKPSKKQLIIVAIIVAVIGVATAVASFALTPSVTIQAEALKYNYTGTRREGSLTMVTMYSSDHGYGSFTLPDNATKVTITARGDQCSGAPQAVVSVDGKKILTPSVTATKFTDYSAPVNIPKGTHVLDISFPNDYYNRRKCDRNLFVDKVTFELPNPIPVIDQPTTPPTPTTPTDPTPTNPTPGTPTAGNNGEVRFFYRMGPSFDSYVTNPSAETKTLINNRYDAMEVFTTFFDDKTSWYKKGFLYWDTYAIYDYEATTTFAQHPDWVMRDASGNPLFIPWGCTGGKCPQYAADFGNQGYRDAWIAKAKAALAKGYYSLWIDDVNMDFRVGNGNGDFVAPIDKRTGQPMTEENWRKYMAEFMQQIRAAMPNVELLHNSIWYAGGYTAGAVRDNNPYVKQQMQAATYINIERGFNDQGLTGGGTNNAWSLQSLLAFIDRTHAMGKHVVIDNFAENHHDEEYSLAGYFLISDGYDYYGNGSHAGPTDWWKGYDTNLGKSTSDRYNWNGVLRRDFTGGMVLVNEPGASTKTIQLGSTYKNIDGASVTSVTLGPSSGAILTK